MGQQKKYIDLSLLRRFKEKCDAIYSKLADLSGKVDKVTNKGLIDNGVSGMLSSSTISRAPSTPGGHPLRETILYVDGSLLADKVYKSRDEMLELATQDAVDSKVDKVEGKGLSTNDYTDEDKAKVAGCVTISDVNILKDDINLKVDKVDGHGLISTAVADEMRLMSYQTPPTIVGDPDSGITEIPGEEKQILGFLHGISVAEDVHVGGKKLVFNEDGTVTWTTV